MPLRGTTDMTIGPVPSAPPLHRDGSGAARFPSTVHDRARSMARHSPCHPERSSTTNACYNPPRGISRTPDHGPGDRGSRLLALTAFHANAASGVPCWLPPPCPQLRSRQSGRSLAAGCRTGGHRRLLGMTEVVVCLLDTCCWWLSI